MKQIDHDTFELSTGRRFEALFGVMGIAPDDADDPAGVSFGGDGQIRFVDEFGPPQETWTLEEREELADFMIELWRRFKANIRKPSESV